MPRSRNCTRKWPIRNSMPAIPRGSPRRVPLSQRPRPNAPRPRTNGCVSKCCARKWNNPPEGKLSVRKGSSMYDAIIVGAGPAGLNAALILGRCRRKVLVCDEGKPRNGVSRGVNGFITREGVLPHELRRIGREELRDYPSVEIRENTVIDDVN